VRKALFVPIANITASAFFVRSVALSATLNTESEDVEMLCGKAFVDEAKAAFTLNVVASTKPIRDCYLDHLKEGLPQLINALPSIREKYPDASNVLDALEMM
jgi:hypothetical protein